MIGSSPASRMILPIVACLIAISACSCAHVMSEKPRAGVSSSRDDEALESFFEQYGIDDSDVKEFVLKNPEMMSGYYVAPSLYRKKAVGMNSYKTPKAVVDYETAMELYERGDLDSASQLLEKALRIRPDSPTIHAELGDINFERGLYQTAVKNYQNAIDNARSLDMVAVFYMDQSLAYMKMRRYDKAQEVLLQAISIAPDDPFINYNLGIAYMDDGKSAEAIPHFQKSIVADELAPDARMAMGLCYSMQGKLERSLEQFLKVVELRGTGQDWYNVAVTQFNMERFAEAQKSFERSIEAGYPKTKIDRFFSMIRGAKRRNARIAYNRGVTLQKQMKHNEAIAAFAEAIELDPTMKSAYLNQAFSYHKVRQTEKAIEALKRAIEIDPNFVEAKYNLGSIYLENGRYREAERMLSEVVEARPYMAEARLNFGLSLYYRRKYLEAEEQFARVVQERPTWAEALYNLALTHIKLGKTEQAKKELENVLRLDPTHRQAREALANIRGEQ